MPGRSYTSLRKKVSEAVERGKLDRWPSDTQRSDWAYGNTRIENDAVTREMTDEAVKASPKGG